MSIHSRTAAPGSSVGGGDGSTGSAQPKSHPLASVTVSPADAAYAVASGKNFLHIFRLNHDTRIGYSHLEEIRSVRISQHFQSPVQTTNSASRGQTPQYPHLRDALRLPGAPPAVAPLPSPSTGGGGGININVTDVAWSLPQRYLSDDDFLPPAYNGNTWPKRGDGVKVSGYEELVSPSGVLHTDQEQHEQHYHYPPFIQRHVVRDEIPYPASQIYDDSSVITAAGSNGVIVAWNAAALLSSSALTSDVGGVGSVRSQQASLMASMEQPEATFLAHTRAVNRLAWHPTGRRPYLLLSASSDGTVRLWDRRATSSSSLHHHGAGGNAGNSASQSKLNQTVKSWFGIGNSLTIHSALQPQTSALTRSATWHCISTYQPKCEAVREVSWNPVIDDLFALVAGEWLCIYDIRINKPMVKESTHAGEATCVDWHPTRKYCIATGGGRDRNVKVWDFESALNINKQDDTSMNYMKANACSFKSENSELSTASHTSSSSEIGSTQHAVHSVSSGSVSPVKRGSSSSFGFSSRHHKKKLPLHVLNIAAPVTRVRWRLSDDDSNFIAVATSSTYGANAGGNGTVGLWSIHRPYMPISVCEGHTEGAVTDFTWAPISCEQETCTGDSTDDFPRRDEKDWQTILSVGRDGQCLLQDFTYGERPILHVPRACFALANLSPFQPGFGSLQIMAIHQHVTRPDLNEREHPDHSGSRLVFSITDQGDAEDLSKASSPGVVEIASELTHFSRLSEHYITKPEGDCKTKAAMCRYNAAVAKGLNRKAITQMWKTLATIMDGSGLDGLPANLSDSHSNPMAYLLTATVQNLLLQRADAGDVQTCVVLCEAMDVIVPPDVVGGAAKSSIPNISMNMIREWYLSYIDLLQQMCLFTQAAGIIRYCSDPVIGALNQQSTTIHEACPRCGKPLLGNTTAGQDGAPQLSAQRVCKSCRGRIGLCFLCHQPVKGVFIWCPGCGHGGHLDHAMEWFGTNEVCPTGCGHRCNLLKTYPPNQT